MVDSGDNGNLDDNGYNFFLQIRKLSPPPIKSFFVDFFGNCSLCRNYFLISTIFSEFLLFYLNFLICKLILVAKNLV